MRTITVTDDRMGARRALRFVALSWVVSVCTGTVMLSVLQLWLRRPGYRWDWGVAGVAAAAVLIVLAAVELHPRCPGCGRWARGRWCPTCWTERTP
jgi:uncharacterized membrane protein YqjE